MGLSSNHDCRIRLVLQGLPLRLRIDDQSASSKVMFSFPKWKQIRRNETNLQNADNSEGNRRMPSSSAITQNLNLRYSYIFPLIINSLSRYFKLTTLLGAGTGSASLVLELMLYNRIIRTIDNRHRILRKLKHISLTTIRALTVYNSHELPDCRQVLSAFNISIITRAVRKLYHTRTPTVRSIPSSFAAMATSAFNSGDHFFEADNVRFHYRVGGSGSLLIAHSVGWGMPGSYMWNGLGPNLEKSHTVVYFEPRGNGQTSKPSDETTMSSKTMAEDIEHLRRYLGIETIPILLGHSNGACIILQYAEVHPTRVEKLILIDAEIHDSPPNDSFQQWAAKRNDDPVYCQALAALAGVMQLPPKNDEEFSAMMEKLLPWYFSDPSHVPTLRKHITAEVTPPTVWAFLTQSLRFDREPENRLPHIADASKVTAKTLVLWGEEDAMCSLIAARAVTEAIRDANLVLFENAGHMPWIEKPDEFWAAVDDFI